MQVFVLCGDRPMMDYRHSASEELCPVCGDRVSGYHYGLLTCESCKGFFKRTVQDKKRYVCAETQTCWIDKAQRKRCPFCRFQKCLEVGMRLEAVRADRMRGGRNKFGPLYKLDRTMKQQRRAQAEAHVHTDSSDLVSSGAVNPPSFSMTSETKTYYTYGANIPHFTMVHGHPKNPRGPRKPNVPLFVLELLSSDPDETQVQNKIRQRLQQHKHQWKKHGQPGLFRLIFHLSEQMLLSFIEWARTSVFFKQLEVIDQMTLLHHCWSELLLLDHINRQVLQDNKGQLLLITGYEVSVVGCHAGHILSSVIQLGQDLIAKFQLLKVDREEFVCMKYLLIFNPDGKQLENRLFIESVQGQVRGALLDYALSSQYPSRFSQLLQCLSEIHFLSTLAEEYLWTKHENGEVPSNSLLTEMLYAKRRYFHL
uniref:Nuclear receptor subfamily 5 group A member 1 n=1 Tax=Neogobius melanostomus TaxID=47308 RepID=A0A8C6T9B0_9GOBI